MGLCHLLLVVVRAYCIAPVWAMQVKGRTAGELAGIIHRAHQRFGFLTFTAEGKKKRRQNAV